MNRMRVHYLQHVPFEGLGSIGPWLESRGASVTGTRFFKDHTLPTMDDIDFVIVMGGPMSVNDESIHPWLKDEKRFIGEAITRRKVVLGVCLGAQLIANAMGARVYPNSEREIGWFPIQWVHAGGVGDHLRFPKESVVFHWHGETFDLPLDATLLARSAACEHQAFSLGERVLGLQFHLETTAESARALIEHCPSDLAPARWVQSEHEILREEERFRCINLIMSAVLNRLGELAV